MLNSSKSENESNDKDDGPDDLLTSGLERALSHSSTYHHLMISENDCTKIAEKFMEEISYLRISDAKNKDFSFNACFQRFMCGYNITLFNYKNAEPVKAYVSADGYGISIKQPYSLEQHFSYQSFAGMILGANSSTFERYQ